MLFNILIGQALRRWLRSMEEAERGGASPPEPIPQEHVPVVREVDEYSLAADSVAAKPAVELESEEWVFPTVQRTAMGSLWEIYLAGTDRGQLVAAAEEGLDEIERLDRQLSHYKDDSDISRLNAHAGEQWVRLEPKLYFLLKRCVELSEMTGGAFDITTGPLTKAWGFFKGEKRIPPVEEVATVMENVGAHRILFDDEHWLVYFTRPGMEINLGAIGKGYAIDEAVKTLRSFNVQNAVIHGGQSTIYAMGSPPESVSSQDDDDFSSGWLFDIKDPRDRETVIQSVYLSDEALSTSGSYEDFFEVEGVRYSHIIDPRNGYPAKGVLSVSVIAPNAADSDVLSTAFFVMGVDASVEFCKSHPELRVIIIESVAAGDIRVTRIGFDP